MLRELGLPSQLVSDPDAIVARRRVEQRMRCLWVRPTVSNFFVRVSIHCCCGICSLSVARLLLFYFSRWSLLTQLCYVVLAHGRSCQGAHRTKEAVSGMVPEFLVGVRFFVDLFSPESPDVGRAMAFWALSSYKYDSLLLVHVHCLECHV